MPKPKRCTICKADTGDLVYLDLEVIGSEGVWVCPACRRVLTDVAKALKQRYAVAFAKGWGAGRKQKAGDGPRKHRTLVRIVGLPDDRVAFALYGFRNFQRVSIAMDDLPENVRYAALDPLGSIGKRFHVWANLEAKTEEEVGFENWQVGPEPERK